MVRLDFKDNAMGILEANLALVFDPFFTTKLGQLASGLDMNIVNTLVSEALGGCLISSAKRGMQPVFSIHIVLPQVLPQSTLSIDSVLSD
ncbi:hypothetical protein [Undibacterium sp. Ren11W]|uniref:hypothetical protein n=1 Tax=Undibacterium sp. Ren11W TaxID=3413045 RepID=UPI003BF062E8